MPDFRPSWLRDLIRFLPLRSQFVLSGNVRDQYPVEVTAGLMAPMPLVSCLGMELRREGMAHFLVFDPAQGFSLPLVHGLNPQAERDFFAKLLGLTWAENGRAVASCERFFELLEVVVRHTGKSVSHVPPRQPALQRLLHCPARKRNSFKAKPNRRS